MTPDELRALKARIGDRTIIASVSGGKDSAAMCLHLMEMGLPFERVFLDTGWEHPATYEYLRGPLAAKIGPIFEARGDRDMLGWIRHKGIFPSRRIRYCTDLLKVQPMKAHLRARVDGGEDVINCVGIRRAESEARARMAEWEWSGQFDCDVWRPLIDWTEQDVIDIHTRHDLRPNPLYLRGVSRVGCWPCIYARKSEIRQLAEIDPGRVDEIRALEQELSERAGDQRSWFQAATGKIGVWCIDRVVAWAHTSRGGRQFEMFGQAPDAGCMRWGLCETMADDEARTDGREGGE